MSGSLDDLLSALAEADSESDVSLRGLTTATVREFGGEAGFAKELVDLAKSADSDAVRARLMAAAAELVNKNAQHGEEGGIARMTDEELEEGILAFLPVLVEKIARESFGETWSEKPLSEFIASLSGRAA